VTGPPGECRYAQPLLCEETHALPTLSLPVRLSQGLRGPINLRRAVQPQMNANRRK